MLLGQFYDTRYVDIKCYEQIWQGDTEKKIKYNIHPKVMFIPFNMWTNIVLITSLDP